MTGEEESEDKEDSRGREVKAVLDSVTASLDWWFNPDRRKTKKKEKKM